ncbi:hypothetical protein SEVIR_3G056701v4 [Setaria viridis]
MDRCSRCQGRAHSCEEALSTFLLLLIKTRCVSCCSFRNSLCHFSLGKKPWSIITVGVRGEKRWHHMFVFQDGEHLPFVYLWQLAGWLAILIRNCYFSSPTRSTLQALNVSANRLRIGLPIIAKIIAQL